MRNWKLAKFYCLYINILIDNSASQKAVISTVRDMAGEVVPPKRRYEIIKHARWLCGQSQARQARALA